MVLQCNLYIFTNVNNNMKTQQPHNILVLVTCKVTENLGFYHAETDKQIWVNKGVKTFQVKADWDKVLHCSGDFNLEQSIKEVLGEMSNDNIKYEFVQQELMFGAIEDISDRVIPKFEEKIMALA